MKKTTRLACLTAGLVSTWDATPAQASQSFTGQITPAQNLSSVYFLFGVGGCPFPNDMYTKKIADFIPGGVTTSFSFTVNSIPGIYYGANFQYSIVGVYDTANAGLSLSYNPVIAADIFAQSPAPTWDGETVPGFPGNQTFIGITESDLAADLESGTANGVSLDDANTTENPFFPGDYECPEFNFDPTQASSFTMVNFSGAANGGSGFIVQVVPEPAPLSFMTIGSALLLFGRLRKQKAG